MRPPDPLAELEQASRDLVARSSDYVYELTRPHSPPELLLLTDQLITAIRRAEAALDELTRRRTAGWVQAESLPPASSS